MRDFLHSAMSFFSSQDHPVCGTLAERLRDTDWSPQATFLAFQDSEPATCSHLSRAFASPNAIGLAKDLAGAGERLTWRESGRGKLSSFMDGRNAIMQAIGPEAGFFSERFRFGAFLLAPETFYPLHSHAAEEVYIPISGSGRWRMNDSAYEPRTPGAIVHVEPWVPHGIRSGAEPLLMLWAWLGDIDLSHYRIEPNAFDDDGKPL